MEKKDGYLTVFFSLILSVMLSLCLMLIIGARENTRHMEMEYAMDSGMNNVLAEYHRELFNRYNLFFIDTSYGSAAASYTETAAHLKSYLEYNLGTEGISLSILYRDPLKLNIENVEITRVSAAADDGGAVLRRQAVDVIYQESGLALIRQVSEWFDTATAYEMDSRDILEEHKAATAELSAWEEKVDFAGTDADGMGSEVISFWEAGVLNLVTEDISELSPKAVETENYLSHRKLRSGTGMNPAVEFADGWLEQLFFHEYILEYTGRFDKEKEDSFLRYQTEYILSGKGTDIENLKNVVYRLLSIRAVANVAYLVTDSTKMGVIETAANVLATLLTVPAIAPLLTSIMLLTWAMAESMYDVSQLLDGKKVPLIKTKADWHYGWKEILGFTWKKEEGGEGRGLSYADYLRLLLLMQDKTITTYRLMDVMEMDIRMTEGNRNFCMDGCIDSVEATVSLRSKDGKDYSITKCYGY